jgi:hypothetical protein
MNTGQEVGEVEKGGEGNRRRRKYEEKKIEGEGNRRRRK